MAVPRLSPPQPSLDGKEMLGVLSPTEYGRQAGSTRPISRDRGDSLSGWADRSHSPDACRPISPTQKQRLPSASAATKPNDLPVIAGKVVPPLVDEARPHILVLHPLADKPRVLVLHPLAAAHFSIASIGEKTRDAAIRKERRNLAVAATPERYRAAARGLSRRRNTGFRPVPCVPVSHGRHGHCRRGEKFKSASLTEAGTDEVQQAEEESPEARERVYVSSVKYSDPDKSPDPRSLQTALAMRTEGWGTDELKAEDAMKRLRSDLYAISPLNYQAHDRKAPSKISPLKPVLRRGANWLESKQEAFRLKLQQHGSFLESHPIDQTAQMHMHAIENMPRSPPPTHRKEQPESADRAPGGWHVRENEKNAPFMGIIVANKMPRKHINIGGEYWASLPTCGVEYLTPAAGEDWRLDPGGLEQDLAVLCGHMRQTRSGRWSVAPHPTCPWKGVCKGRAAVGRDTPKYVSRATTSLSFNNEYEDSVQDTRGKMSIVEDSCIQACYWGQNSSAVNLVGGLLPSLQRDGFRSRAGKKFDAMAKLSGDMSLCTHGSYTQWRENQSKLVRVT